MHEEVLAFAKKEAGSDDPSLLVPVLVAMVVGAIREDGRVSTGFVRAGWPVDPNGKPIKAGPKTEPAAL